MTRLSIVAIAFVCLGLGAFLLPALSQAPIKPVPPFATPSAKPNDATLAIMRELKKPVKIKELQDEEGVKLSFALNLISKATQGKVPILLDVAAFLEGVEAVADPYDRTVRVPHGMEIMPLEMVLRVIIGQIGDGRNSFWIHPSGYITIIPTRHMNDRSWLYESSILANFDQRPLKEVLSDLSNSTGAPIYVDPTIGKASDTPISALFNNNTLEQALVAITEMAHLKYVVLERGILVTTAENAKVVTAEEEERAAAREVFQRSRERLVEKPGA